MSSPARKNKDKSSKKPGTYQPTMANWIEMYQKFKDAKEIDRPYLNPSQFLISDESGTKFSIKQSIQNKFSREYSNILNGELINNKVDPENIKKLHKLKRCLLSM